MTAKARPYVVEQRQETSINTRDHRLVIKRADRYAKRTDIMCVAGSLALTWAVLGLITHYLVPVSIGAWFVISGIVGAAGLALSSWLVRDYEAWAWDDYMDAKRATVTTTREQYADEDGRDVIVNNINGSTKIKLELPAAMMGDTLIHGRWIESLQDAMAGGGLTVSRATLSCGAEQERAVRKAFYALGWIDGDWNLTEQGITGVVNWPPLPRMLSD